MKSTFVDLRTINGQAVFMPYRLLSEGLLTSVALVFSAPLDDPDKMVEQLLAASTADVSRVSTDPDEQITLIQSFLSLVRTVFLAGGRLQRLFVQSSSKTVAR